MVGKEVMGRLVMGLECLGVYVEGLECLVMVTMVMLVLKSYSQLLLHQLLRHPAIPV